MEIMTNKMNEELNRELKIVPPQGYEIDEENSTFKRIVFKKKHEIKTWDDLCEASAISDKIRISGYTINDLGYVYPLNNIQATAYSTNVFVTEKQAKSARAAAIISQLMPYYGEAITDKEWKDYCMKKFVITRSEYGVHFIESVCWFHFLAFRTEEQRNNFYKHNKKLVEEYLMID